MPAVRQPTLRAGSVRLLRYRFESAEQVYRHFHVVQGRVVLFYPCLLSLRAGEPVLLDVAFASSEQHCALRGSVIGQESGGQHSGCWLELGTPGIVAAVRGAVVHPKRRQRRFPSEVLVNVARHKGMPIVGKLVDLSFGGGRISGLSIAIAGEALHLSVAAQRSDVLDIAARVAWTRGSDLGVEFVKPSHWARVAIAELIEGSNRALADAFEATHPASCHCLEGSAAAEPPAPRSAHRQTAPR